jgi:broad specificity phosphatase PhoE
MTDIYVVRHGQTAWNKEEIFRGRTDVPLNEMGLKEASLAAEFFRGREVQAIYSSPLSRAWQTAGKIAEVVRREVVSLDGINDMSFGAWEGQPLRNVQKNDSERYNQWGEAPHLVKIPGGETLDDVRLRAMAALEEVIRSHAGASIVLVSHRVINKVLICGILGLDNSHFWQIGQDTTAINLIQHRHGRYVLSLMNESCHLKPLQDTKIKVDF